ncbi:Outer membrane efflux protein BepC [Methylacidimicrobium cyclopophantes]|uniref:Outer membrane efflux protein BepC n=1 Tax=Methylacidimicrobium cyclopophantes TaxID=1041766 RepID=A0A5E6MI73_9BACT|nr:TolC family protein [Methylacidimicrobium cyclopophantes]VVM05746.1 Outer membrane efflux protein BepC [Methylacidimicrobium cyclopophantes]
MKQTRARQSRPTRRLTAAGVGVVLLFSLPFRSALARLELEADKAQATRPVRALPAYEQPVQGRPAPGNAPPLEALLQAVSPIAGKRSDPKALDLAACYQMAAIRWDQLKIDYQTLRAQQAVVTQTLSAFFPQFSWENMQSFQNTTGVIPTVSGVAVGTSQGYFSFNSINTTWLLFDSLRQQNRVAAARADAAAQSYTLQRDYQMLYLNVAQAFYQELNYEGSVSILEDQIAALQGLVTELEYRLKIGRSRPADVFQGQANLAAAVAQREGYVGLMNQYKATLNYYLGIGPEKVNLKETQPFPSSQSLEEYLVHVGSRPDVLAQLQLLRAQKAQLAVAIGNFGPRAGVAGSYFLSHQPDSPVVWTVNIVATMPLFTGGLLTSTVREERALVHVAELQVENLKRTADQNLRIAFALFNAAVEQVLQYREQVEVSALYYAAQRDDFQRGVAQLLDVLVALNTYQQARLALHQTEMNARYQLVNLFVQAGLTPTNIDATGLPLQNVLRTGPPVGPNSPPVLKASIP